MSGKVWVVGAGKGGVGKTFVASSMGVTLARMKNRVLLVDLDFSGANMHTAIGESAKRPGLEHYWFSGAALGELVFQSQVGGMFYVRGFSHQWVSWNPTAVQAKKLISDLAKLHFDYIILDLGPGGGSFHAELFKAADEKIVITSPEPTSIEKTYRLWESIIGDSWVDQSPEALHQIVLESMGRYRQNYSICETSFREFVEQSLPAEPSVEAKKPSLSLVGGPSFSQAPPGSGFRLVMNGSRSLQDNNLGHSIKSVSKKHFNIDVDYVGALDYDNAVWQSMRTFQLLLHEKPYIPLTGQVLNLCKQILNTNFDATPIRAVI